MFVLLSTGNDLHRRCSKQPVSDRFTVPSHSSPHLNFSIIYYFLQNPLSAFKTLSLATESHYPTMKECLIDIQISKESGLPH